MNLWRGVSWKRRTAVVAGASALLLFGVVAVGYARTTVPPPNKIATDQALRLLYSDGSEMGRFGKNRVLVRLDQVSVDAQHAVLAAEDREFYNEPGISLKGIARALFTNVRGGGVSQGGSTITQQYAKNAFLSQERTFTRKIKEAFIAVKMSQTVSKDQILEDYLNTIYFGRGAFGIEAAAQTYFHTTASQLTLAQSAVLASSIRSPAGYDPTRHPDRAKARAAYVLDGMLKKGWITAEERAHVRYPAVWAPKESSSLPGDLALVRDQVVADLQRHGFSEAQIAAGGLTVTTTIDKQTQLAARTAIQDRIPASKHKDDPVAALVAIEPGTGKVVAYYGGRNAGEFDYADGGPGVQPGSSMKPYVLATALLHGKKLSDTYDGRSPQNVCGQKVHNDGGDPPFGHIDLATALAHSVNTVYTRLACDVGPKNVAALAHSAGIDERQKLDGGDGHPSIQIALGSGGYEVHPLDQAAGYSTFAAQGMRATPYFVVKVTDQKGTVLYAAKPSTARAFPADVAADTTYAMQQVVLRGTGTKAKIPGRPTAGKTGTTSGNTNAWFCGFTPQLAVAVWVGRPSGHALKGVLGIRGGVYGGQVPAKIFSAFMLAALKGKPVVPFPARANTGPTPSPAPLPSVTATPSASPTPSATPSVVPTVPLPTLFPSATPTATPSGAAPTSSP